MREELVWLDEESSGRRGALGASLEFVGALGLLLFASVRGIVFGRLEGRETLHQMAFIGAASAPIVALTSAFTGAVGILQNPHPQSELKPLTQFCKTPARSELKRVNTR